MACQRTPRNMMHWPWHTHDLRTYVCTKVHQSSQHPSVGKRPRERKSTKKKDQTLFTASNFSWETGCVNQTSDDKIDEFHTGMASLSKKYRRFKLTSQHSLLSSDTVHRVLDHNDNACWFFFVSIFQGMCGGNNCTAPRNILQLLLFYVDDLSRDPGSATQRTKYRLWYYVAKNELLLRATARLRHIFKFISRNGWMA